jgi:hypothetical protein
MNLNPIASVLSRIFSLAAFLLLVLSIAEWLSNAFGYTILRQAYRPGRMMEFAAIFAIFFIAMLLRQVREELRKGNRAS